MNSNLVNQLLTLLTNIQNNSQSINSILSQIIPSLNILPPSLALSLTTLFNNIIIMLGNNLSPIILCLLSSLLTFISYLLLSINNTSSPSMISIVNSLLNHINTLLNNNIVDPIVYSLISLSGVISQLISTDLKNKFDKSVQDLVNYLSNQSHNSLTPLINTLKSPNTITQPTQPVQTGTINISVNVDPVISNNDIQTQSDPNLNTQSNPNLNTQSNPNLNTQSNPSFNIQANPNFQTQIDPQLQLQLNNNTLLTLTNQLRQQELIQYQLQQQLNKLMKVKHKKNCKYH